MISFPHFLNVASGIIIALPTALFARPIPVIYVDQGATGANDGSSWEDAYVDLQDGLSEAGASHRGEVQIWVATGTYTPASPGGNRSASFWLINGVGLYGGFAGGETCLGQRSPGAHPTVLSGDLNGDDEPGFQFNGENSYHVVRGSSTNATAILDGFIITAGHANGADTASRGAGMCNQDGSPTLNQCTFLMNLADNGGGMHNLLSSPTLTNCTFDGNCVSLHGGGICNEQYSDPTLIRCTFHQNEAGDGGGGLHNDGSDPILDTCTFTDNWAGWYAGGVTNVQSNPLLIGCTFIDNTSTWDGGAVDNYQSSPTLTGCTFLGNVAALHGGAVYNWESATTLINCALSGNAAYEVGGAVCNVHSELARFINCTFSHNTADQTGGGMYVYQGGRLVICILWGNSDAGGTDESAQIHVVGQAISVDYTCVQGWTGGWGGEGNLGDDPLLADADGPDEQPGTDDDNLRLLPGSLCINSGDNASVPPLTAIDLDGHARVLCSQVDMGAYEFGIGDYDCSQQVDLLDYDHWLDCMGGPTGGQCGQDCEALDFDHDGDVDLVDFAGFQAAFTGS